MNPYIYHVMSKSGYFLHSQYLKHALVIGGEEKNIITNHEQRTPTDS